MAAQQQLFSNGAFHLGISDSTRLRFGSATPHELAKRATQPAARAELSRVLCKPPPHERCFFNPLCIAAGKHFTIVVSGIRIQHSLNSAHALFISFSSTKQGSRWATSWRAGPRNTGATSCLCASRWSHSQSWHSTPTLQSARHSQVRKPLTLSLDAQHRWAGLSIRREPVHLQYCIIGFF